MHAARHMSNILTSSVTAVIEAAAFATYHPHALKPERTLLRGYIPFHLLARSYEELS